VLERLVSHEEFPAGAENRKALTMEYFYRDVRRKTGMLMNGEEPVGGKDFGVTPSQIRRGLTKCDDGGYSSIFQQLTSSTMQHSERSWA
jgi:hypothetical protein